MRLLCLGDVALIDREVARQVWDPPVEGIPSDDLRILFNLEGPLGGAINPLPRSSGPRILAHPDAPSVLQRWAPGFVALANNHILDGGEEGLEKTIREFEQMGFTTVGAGRTPEEITRPLFWETSEGRLGIANWVFPETHPEWKCVPGPNCWPGTEGARSILRDLKRDADWVLVLLHWSDEWFPYPRPEDRAVARELAEMGADLIVGHHPHVVRGMEMLGSCPVFYSIGHFYFSDIPDGQGGWIDRWGPRNREVPVIDLSFCRDQPPEYRMLSFWQAKNRVLSDPLKRAARRFERVSRPLRDYEGARYAEWYSQRRAAFFTEFWGYPLHFGLWRMGRSGLKRKVLKPFRSLSLLGQED
jgi:poly-gamma-glutamate synthesis protein (capsule biosynthesis protein)